MRLRKKKTLMEHAADYLEDTVIPSIESAVSSAKDKAGPMIADARDKAGPVIADARDKAAEAAAVGAELAAEKAAVAKEVAVERAATARVVAAEQLAAAREVAAEKAASGRDLAAAKVAQVKGEPEPKSHRLRNLLLFGGLLAIAGVVARKLAGGGTKTDNWQSSYTPAPPPSPRPTPVPSVDETATPIADSIRDEGGADPGEALADATEEPHAVTTPDSPADVVDVDVEGEKKK